jgi:hypothetical protein
MTQKFSQSLHDIGFPGSNPFLRIGQLSTGPFEKFVDWRQCVAVIQRGSGGGNVVVE